MSLEIRRKQLEYERVKLARQELEFKILEREEEIKRIKDHIAIQLKKEQELINEIEGK